MEDILKVYQRPFDEFRPQVCLDEASRQLLSETRLGIPVKPGRPKRTDAEYRRNGTASVFMLNAPLLGERHVRVRRHRTKQDFAEIIRELCDDIYPYAEKIVLVMDNLNTHKIGSLYDTFDPETASRLADKLEIHYTPVHGSWLNMAEIELSVLSRQCMKDYFENRQQLADATAAWERSRNENKSGIDWRFTTADARIKLKKLYPTI